MSETYKVEKKTTKLIWLSGRITWEYQLLCGHCASVLLDQDVYICPVCGCYLDFSEY